MLHGSLASLLAAFVPLLATGPPAEDASWIGREATRSRITIIDVDGALAEGRPRLAPSLRGAGVDARRRRPDRQRRRQALAPARSRAARPRRSRPARRAGSTSITPSPPTASRWPSRPGRSGRSPPRAASRRASRPPRGTTSTPGRPTASGSPSRPTGGSGLDLFSIAPDGGSERRLTTGPRADDAPQYSPDGRWIYFLSDRAGTRDIWRIPASGAGPADAKAEQITGDDREDAAPHPSPDGKWLIYLSYPASHRPQRRRPRRPDPPPPARRRPVRPGPSPRTSPGSSAATGRSAPARSRRTDGGSPTRASSRPRRRSASSCSRRPTGRPPRASPIA